MIVNSANLALSAYDLRQPVIGYNTVVTALSITATTEEAGNPASNMANPATHLKWRGGVNTSGVETLTITLPVTTVDYVGIARHNLGTQAYQVTVNSTQPFTDGALLHFDGVDGATTFTDEAGHTWTANGNAQIDTAQKKFGVSSLLFDGTGDFVTGNGSSDFAFGTGDYTVDAWIRLNALGQRHVIYDNRPNSADGPMFYVETDNKLHLVVVGTVITGSTTLTTGVWYHVALTRSAGNTRLFLNGIQEGSTWVASTNFDVGGSRPIFGANGGNTAEAMNGWIDEMHVVKGAALWTANFTPPTSPYNFQELISSFTVSDDLPLVLRFPAIVAGGILTITLTPTTQTVDPPEIAVLYAGESLLLERSIDVNSDHVPLPLGRRTSVVSGRSVSGQFLGRIVLGEWRESVAKFMWFNPDWYRANFDPFVVAAQEVPFFWVWNPADYPEDTGYGWLTENPSPEVNPVTQRVGVDLKMQGVA